MSPLSPRRTSRQLTVGVALLLATLTLAVACIALTVHRQRERDRATAAALDLCRQVNGLGRRCAVDPTALPWATGTPDGQAVAPAPAPLVPLPTVHPGVTATSPPVTDQAGVADPLSPGGGDAPVSIQLTGGRLILGYADGTRVDAGHVSGDLVITGEVVITLVTPSAHPTPTPTGGHT